MVNRLAMQFNFIMVVTYRSLASLWLWVHEENACNSQLSSFVDVVFNFAVDHVVSNLSRKCTH